MQASKLHESLDIENSRSRLGVYSFSTSSEYAVEFEHSSDFSTFQRKIVDANQLLGDTTDYEQMVDDALGYFDRLNNPNNHRYIILITNGKG